MGLLGDWPGYEPRKAHGAPASPDETNRDDARKDDDAGSADAPSDFLFGVSALDLDRLRGDAEDDAAEPGNA